MPTLAKTDKHVSKHIPITQARAKSVRFMGNVLYIALRDGREISIPIEQVDWLQWLAAATPEQRAKWSLEPGGFAIYWEELDDGIEICHLDEFQQ